MIAAPSGSRLSVGVVGASGFLAGCLIPALKQAGHFPRVFGRTPSTADGVRPPPSKPDDFAGLDVVIHLAGIAHQRATAEVYTAVNVDLATFVGGLCRDAGVGRLVFISTAQVHGRHSEEAISPQSPMNPQSAYAVSKLRAERQLADLLGASGTDLSIVRPVLVYGPNVKANFRKLRTAARLGAPLPLGRAEAMRSMVSIDNLNDAIMALASTKRQNAICLPADPEDYSVSQIYITLCSMAGKRNVFLPPVPVWAMRSLMNAVGQSASFDSLFRKAVIDRTHWTELGWTPPQSVADGLQRAMRD